VDPIPQKTVPQPRKKEPKRCDVGAGCVSAWAIWVIVTLAVVATLLCLYGLWALWPADTPTVSVDVVLFTHHFTVTAEQQLLALVALAGALGGFVHLLRSLGRYVGNRQLLWSWVAHYALIPVTAAAAATIFYIVARAGLFANQPPQQQSGNAAASTSTAVAAVNPFGLAAVAALVGLFTEEAMQMLKRVACNVFAPPERAEDKLAVPDDPDTQP
jgi:hypothetical protein